MPPVHPKCRLPSHDNGQVFKRQKIGAFGTLCGRRKREGGRGREKSTKVGKREGSACYKSQCFCILPTINFLNYCDNINCHCMTNLNQGSFSPWFDLNITLFTRYCQVETLFSSDVIIERNKTFFTVLAPTANMTTRLQAASLFYCSQLTTNNDQFRVNTHDLRSYLIKHNGHKEQSSCQHEMPIMKGEL